MKKIIYLITPPIILSGLKKIIFLFEKIFHINKRFEEPTWNTIISGPIKNKKILLCSSGSWQKEIINGKYDEFFFDYLQKINLKGKNIFDIGAHIGYSAMCFAEITGPSGKVFTFEPNIYNLERLKINIKENDEISDRIKIFNFAISDRDGQENFIFSHKIESMASGSFLDSAHTSLEKNIYEEKLGFKKIKTEIKSIDNLYKNDIIADKVNLIKIDVEGAEYLVIRGGEKTIKQYRPILFIEIHSIYNMLMIGKMLNQWNYKMELLKEEKDGRCFLCARP